VSVPSRKIIGIDPGSRNTGFGIVRTAPGGLLSGVAWGVIRIDPSLDFPDRLFTIHDELSRIIRLHEPDEAVVEKVFLAKNASSALKLGQARGAAIVTCRIHRLPVSEFSAREIKAAATGFGAASKEQVAGMVGKLLGIREPIPPDASDALAIAFCGATTVRFARSNPPV
jgi:crossover junction endodeoxyribonuclease RuvC